MPPGPSVLRPEGGEALMLFPMDDHGYRVIVMSIPVPGMRGTHVLLRGSQAGAGLQVRSRQEPVPNANEIRFWNLPDSGWRRKSKKLLTKKEIYFEAALRRIAGRRRARDG